MIRLIRILWHRQIIKNARGLLLDATPQVRGNLLREIAVSRLRLSQLEDRS
jgi:hypothetical protein